MAKKKSSKRSLVRGAGKSQTVVAAGLAAVVADQVLAGGAVARGLLGEQAAPSSTELLSNLAAIEPVALGDTLDATAPAVREALAAVEPEAVAEELLSADAAKAPAESQDVLLAQANTAVAAPAEAAAADAAASQAAAAEGQAAAAPVAGEGAVGLAAVPPAAIAAGVIGGVAVIAAASSDDNDTAPTEEPGVSGVVVDGYLSDATVSRVNGSGNTVKTDENGNFSGLQGTGAIMVVGGTDISTGQPFNGTLYAPEGSTVVTPLTTLVQALIEQGVDAATAQSQVLTSLGLNPGFDLLNTDPYADAATDEDAFAALKAGSAVATALQTLAGGDEATFASLVEALAAQMKANPDLDLQNINTDFLQQLADDAEVTLLEGVDLAAVVAGIGNIIDSNSAAEMAKFQGNVLAEQLGAELGYKEPEPVGQVKIASSLMGMAALSPNPAEGAAAGSSFLVAGGVGAQADAAAWEGVYQFDQGLDVNLQLSSADDAGDGLVDGTISLNTSLAGMAGLGIDTVVGDDGQSVAIMGGVGAATLADLQNTSIKLGGNLQVTQHVTQADLTSLGGFAGGMATALSNNGVDTLSVGDATLGLDDVSALLDAGLNFAASDNISFVDVAGTALASNGIDLDDLGNLGVDSVDVNVGTADTIGIDANTGMGSAGMDAESLGNALADLVEKFQGQVFATEDEVTLHVGEGNAVAGLDASLLEDIQLLGIDFLSGSDSLDLNDLNKA